MLEELSVSVERGVERALVRSRGTARKGEPLLAVPAREGRALPA
jgi:hypothetical protein